MKNRKSETASCKRQEADEVKGLINYFLTVNIESIDFDKLV